MNVTKAGDSHNTSWSDYVVYTGLAMIIVGVALVVISASLSAAEGHFEARELLGQGAEDTKEIQEIWNELQEKYMEGVRNLQESLLLSGVVVIMGGVSLLFLSKHKSISQSSEALPISWYNKVSV